MQKKLSIAIDGPAGTGKSTVARALAKQIGYVHVDTGAMYRAVTYKGLQNQASFNDPQQLIDIANNCSIELLPSSDSKTIVRLDGQDVSEEIRTPLVDKNVSAVACIGEIRNLMVTKQRELSKKRGNYYGW